MGTSIALHDCEDALGGKRVGARERVDVEGAGAGLDVICEDAFTMQRLTLGFVGALHDAMTAGSREPSAEPGLTGTALLSASIVISVAGFSA
jgi:hypothetical protein